MAVLMEIEYSGVTAEQYDLLQRRAGTRSGRAIPGLISHAAVISEDGLRVVDVWESAAAMEAFLPALRPALAEAGFPDPAGPPRVSPLHHVHVGA
ncbi:hypothetical protein [Streptomyces sp. NPDC018031]|uniref:hypothetical protein n=1 Tax=Streptomyces sp. NPDC018031 TaxID=3365033 RepID=UPI0037BC8A1E